MLMFVAQLAGNRDSGFEGRDAKCIFEQARAAKSDRSSSLLKSARRAVVSASRANVSVKNTPLATVRVSTGVQAECSRG